jgi:predicted nucleic acid-binding protein
MTLVDTNVFLDILTDDQQWYDWSVARLEEARLIGPLVINDIVYAELAFPYAQIEDLDWAVQRFDAVRMAMPREALYLAGKAYQKYRKSGGIKNGVLPDFFIGAHAAVTGMTLLTRDRRRYETYFPSVTLIAP